MAYSNGKTVLVANATSNNVTVGATTVNSGQVKQVTPADAVLVTLGAEIKAAAEITEITTAALPQAVQKGSVIDFAGVQLVASATAAAAATAIKVIAITPAVAVANAAKGLASSQGEVAGFVEQGCCVVTSGTQEGDVLDVPVQLAEKGAHLLESMARAVISAGANEFAQKGL